MLFQCSKKCIWLLACATAPCSEIPSDAWRLSLAAFLTGFGSTTITTTSLDWARIWHALNWVPEAHWAISSRCQEKGCGQPSGVQLRMLTLLYRKRKCFAVSPHWRKCNFLTACRCIILGFMTCNCNLTGCRRNIMHLIFEKKSWNAFVNERVCIVPCLKCISEGNLRNAPLRPVDAFLQG